MDPAFLSVLSSYFPLQLHDSHIGLLSLPSAHQAPFCFRSLPFAMPSICSGVPFKHHLVDPFSYSHMSNATASETLPLPPHLILYPTHSPGPLSLYMLLLLLLLCILLFLLFLLLLFLLLVLLLLLLLCSSFFLLLLTLSESLKYLRI